MKNVKLISILLVVFLCIASAGCSHKIADNGCEDTTAPHASSPSNDNGNNDVSNLYTLSRNNDNTYSFALTDFNGKVIFEKQNTVREPKVEQVAPAVYGLTTQTGTGLSSNWAVYCDVENSITSEIYQYVLAAKDDYVIRADFKNNAYFIIAQDIFDINQYYMEYQLENVSPVAADFAIGCKWDDCGNAIVTYLTGNDYVETELTINLP